MYRAGADCVLSLATVSGRMLASIILANGAVTSLDKQVAVLRTRAPGLGRTLGEADVRARTGCTVVGVERDCEVVTDPGPGFRTPEGDELIIAGTDEGTNRFTETMGQAGDRVSCHVGRPKRAAPASPVNRHDEFAERVPLLHGPERRVGVVEWEGAVDPGR
jgi:hypothetical protein